MTQVILLIGVGSVGKTTVSKHLQDIAEVAYFSIGFDYFVDMMPKKFILDVPKAMDGITFVNKEIHGKTIPQIHFGIYGQRFFKGILKSISVFANSGNNLIVDMVLDHTQTKNLIESFSKDIQVLKVALYAPLDVIRQREVERGDRAVGKCEVEYPGFYEKIEYDLIFDTSTTKAQNIAKEILVNTTI